MLFFSCVCSFPVTINSVHTVLLNNRSPINFRVCVCAFTCCLALVLFFLSFAYPTSLPVLIFNLPLFSTHRSPLPQSRFQPTQIPDKINWLISREFQIPVEAPVFNWIIPKKKYETILQMTKTIQTIESIILQLYFIEFVLLVLFYFLKKQEKKAASNSRILLKVNKFY